jgi:hypothetical protein
MMFDSKRYEEDIYYNLKDQDDEMLNSVERLHEHNTNGRGQLCDAAISVLHVISKIRRERTK